MIGAEAGTYITLSEGSKGYVIIRFTLVQIDRTELIYLSSYLKQKPTEGLSELGS